MTDAPLPRGEAARRLGALGLVLPRVPPPRGAFLPFSRIGPTLWLAGQICEWEGEVRFTGPVPDVATGQRAAELCALNLLAALSLALEGDLDRVVRCHRLGGFVQVSPGWPDVPKAVNGASDLMARLFGEAGRHARTAVGVAGLPADASVEVDGIFEVR
ncbi:RidA family protein [Methylobacterium crusticola]|nr:RidA family protein [Methylobacterium crusticola]